MLIDLFALLLAFALINWFLNLGSVFGAFGFGIPLQGEKKDINFLLGITGAIGKNEPILVTVGAAGAKVNKLANGYQVGSKTRETDPAKLTTNGYGVGGFLSVTFNLNNLGIGKK